MMNGYSTRTVTSNPVADQRFPRDKASLLKQLLHNSFFGANTMYGDPYDQHRLLLTL